MGKEDYKFVNNKDERQYEYHVDGQICMIEYVVKNGKDVYLTHTGVPSDLRGKGLGKQLVQKTLQDIEKNDMDVVPLCAFVASYISKNPQWKRLLKDGISLG